MSEFIDRQKNTLKRFIGDYQEDRITLNKLILNIESISDVIDSQQWKDAVFPIIIELEQVNAANLDLPKWKLSKENQSLVDLTLSNLEHVLTKIDL